MTAYLSALARHGRILLALIVAACVAAAVWVGTLEIETDWSRLFPYPNDAEAMRLLSQVNSVMGVSFFLSATDGSPIAEHLEQVTLLADHIAASGLFADVYTGSAPGGDSMFRPEMTIFIPASELSEFTGKLLPEGMEAAVRDARQLLFSPAGNIATDLLRRDPLQISRYAVDSFKFRSGYEIRDGFIMATNGSHVMLVGIPPRETDAAWLKKAAAFIPTTKETAAEYGLVCRMPGSLLLRAELFDSVRADLARTAALSFVLVTAVFVIIYRRSLRAVFCVMLPLAFALVATFAVYRLFFQRIDMITSMSAAMLIGLGVDYGIHLMSRYRQDVGSVEQRLEAALRETGKGIFAGALTTAVAFFSILATGMQSFYLLGVVAGFGILLCLGAFFFVFPVTVLVFRPFPDPQPPRVAATGRDRTSVLRWAAVPLLLAACALPLFVGRLSFETDVSMFLPRTSRIYRDMMATEGGAAQNSDGLLIQVQSTGQGVAADAARAEVIRGVFPSVIWKSPFVFYPGEDALREQRRVFAAFVAEHGITPEVGREALRATYAGNGLRFPDSLDTYFAGILESYQPGAWEDFFGQLPLVRMFYSEDGGDFLLMAIHEDGRAWTAGQVQAVRAAASTAGINCRTVSGAVLVNEIRSRAVPESIRAALIAFAFITILLKVQFKKWRYVLLTSVPLALGLIWTILLMAILGISFNFFNMTVLPLVFGLGIDDGIHFMQAFRECGRTRRALELTWRPIVLTSVTTCIGFGALMAVSFRGVFMMGLMVVMGLAGCLVATLTVLPVLTDLERKHDSRSLKPGGIS